MQNQAVSSRKTGEKRAVVKEAVYPGKRREKTRLTPQKPPTPERFRLPGRGDVRFQRFLQFLQTLRSGGVLKNFSSEKFQF